MAGLSDTIGAITSGGQSVLWVTMGIIVVLVFVGLILLLLAWYIFSKRKWNLLVEFKLTRSDGKLVSAEWGKGYLNAKRGMVMLKRPGKFQKAVSMQIFDIRRYLQGDKILTVIQAGPDDYRPVLNHSWAEYIDDKPLKDENGEYIKDEHGDYVYEKASVLNIKTDNKDNRAWKDSFEAAAKKAYSLTRFLNQFQVPIAIGIVIISVFVGFSLMWARLGTVCG